MTSSLAHPAPHPALVSGGVAVVTGAASGIGLAAATRFAGLGLKVILVDRPGDTLERAHAQVAAQSAGGAAHIAAIAADVSRFSDLERLRDEVIEAFGPVTVLMNNAGLGANPGKTWENLHAWRDLIDVNLWGAIHGVQAFVPAMLAGAAPGLVINTGSKQGITLPPGNGAYNLSKAGLKAYTETLAHELRGATAGRVTAHLLIPGFTFTGMTGRAEKPAAAWTADQVAQFMIDSLARGDFYILCPDHDVTRETDERRIQWMADDLIQNRPALSRWDPAHKAEFEAFMSRKA
jgi:NAD(P)-dependent dehydrogenase (short-subunit alcohol dehydrogenase family)